jgi:hypothetical protein
VSRQTVFQHLEQLRVFVGVGPVMIKSIVCVCFAQAIDASTCVGHGRFPNIIISGTEQTSNGFPNNSPSSPTGRRVLCPAKPPAGLRAPCAYESRLSASINNSLPARWLGHLLREVPIFSKEITSCHDDSVLGELSTFYRERLLRVSIPKLHVDRL